MNAIIVDDEQGSIATLSMLLERYCPDVEIKGTFTDPLEAIHAIENFHPDVLFLDIEMPFANAFDLLDKLAPVNFEVIFVTAFNNYALKAIKYAAVDYVLKPVNLDDLIEAVERAKKQLSLRKQHNENLRVSGLLQNIKQVDHRNYKITLPTKDGFEIEDVRNIIYLEASGNYTYVILKSGKRILLSKGLVEFEEMLPPENFVRIHHSYIVNMNYVKAYKRGRGGMVQMMNGDELEVAVRKKHEFLTRFGI